MTIVVSISALYLIAGAVVAVKTWEPEQGGWLFVILFWPLQLVSMV